MSETVPLAWRTQEIGALSMRWFRRLAREKYTIGFTLMQPLFWLILFGSLFSMVNPAGAVGPDYLSFVLPGIIVLNVLGAGLVAGMDIMFDKETGFLHRLLATPISRSSIISARLLYVVANSLLQVAILLIVATLMGAHLASLGGLAVILLVAIMLAIAVGAFSLVLAFVYKSHGEFFATIGFVNMPLFFLSSALIPIASMPGWMQTLAKVNPLTYAIDLARAAAVQGVPWGALPVALGALLAMDVAMLALAARVFQRKVD